MNESGETRSVVLASVYRVDDPHRMWARIVGQRSRLASLGAHHAVMYSSTQQHGSVLVTVGIRRRAPLAKLMRSPAIREWFDTAGVDEFPMVFAGEIVEKLNVIDPPTSAPGVVVAAFAAVESAAGVVERVHSLRDRFKDAGVRKLWTYLALDDPREMLFLHGFDDEAHAKSWVERPDQSADWMQRSDCQSYPPPFIGNLVDVLVIESDG